MKRKADLFTITSFLCCISFYLFFAFLDGAVLCVDSPSYINMHSSREPLYPVLLAAAREIFSRFPNGFYLNVVAFFQSILMAVSVFVFEEYLRKELKIQKWGAVLILLMPLVVSLLCRFAAKRGSMYSNSILTEGIAIPLYLIFFRFLLEYIFNNNKKSLLGCIILLFLMISTRKQMIFAFAMLIIGIIYVAYKKKKVGYGIAAVLLSVALVFGTNAVFDVGYNYIVRGEKATHSSDIRFIATIAFYTAEREDAALIEDLNVRELFLEIYDICDGQGYLGHSVGKGWNDRVSHFGDYYDRIQIDTMWPKISHYVQENFDCKQEQIGEYEDEIMGVISKVVIPTRIGRVVRVFWDNFLSGLITTVAQRRQVLIYYSGIIYVLYIVLLFFVKISRKEKKVFIFSLIVLLSIILNVGLVSLVIFCQTRYTIYNMALFYIALIVMISTLLKKEPQKDLKVKEEIN